MATSLKLYPCFLITTVNFNLCYAIIITSMEEQLLQSLERRRADSRKEIINSMIVTIVFPLNYICNMYI